MAVNVEDTLNLLIKELLPVLNKQIPKSIESEDLDPWKKVASGKETLGKINLGICTAKTKASYSIKDMKGLSSLVIQSLTIESIDSTDSLSNVSGTMSLSAKLDSDLSAKVSGDVKASCGFVSESVGISGKVKAKGVTGTGKATFEATLSESKSCFNDIEISQLSLNYKDIDVEIDGLGIFNTFLGPLVDVLDALFGDSIKGEISSVVRGLLNDLLDDTLPLCI